MATVATAFALASPARASELPWLVGYWLDCDGRAAAESWIDAGGDTLLGVGLTRGRTRTSFEFMRIARAADGALTFYGSPNGAPAIAFSAKTQSALSVTFENAAHDFPQRIIYRREGEVLHARVEGTMNGEPEAMRWTYRSAAPNTACPIRP